MITRPLLNQFYSEFYFYVKSRSANRVGSPILDQLTKTSFLTCCKNERFLLYIICNMYAHLILYSMMDKNQQRPPTGKLNLKESNVNLTKS